jgi:hypothetical protein
LSKARSLFACVVLLATALTALSTAQVAEASNYTSTSWKTVINDTFDGTTMPSHWRAYNGKHRANCSRTSHATVSGGQLHLKLKYDSSGDCGAAWYSGGVTLTESLSAPNQRVTVKFRITNSNGIVGHRIVPMLNPNDGTGIGEQDLCESTPYSFCSTFLHYGAPGTTQVRKKYYVDLTQWHTMQFTTNGNRVIAIIDGVKVWDYTGSSTTLPRKLRHVVLQQECVKTGCPGTHSGYEDILIDSIKVENGN